MPKFYIYPKEGRMFSIECRSLQDNRQGYVLNGDRKGFLWIRDLAAIIPERLVEESKEIDNIWFHVCLKGHAKPAKVFAYSCETEPEIVFMKKMRDNKDPTKENEQPIDGIYIDPLEVVAIAPSGFFKS